MLSDHGPVCLSLCLSACLDVTLVYCGQMAGWIKMPLGTEVDSGPGHIVFFVLDEDPLLLPKEAPPNFRLMFVVAKGLDGSRCHLVGK